MSEHGIDTRLIFFLIAMDPFAAIEEIGDRWRRRSFDQAQK